jgi:hypothetical protein
VTVRKGKCLAEGEITLTVGREHRQRVMHVSRPHRSRRRLEPQLLGSLRLGLDSSGLCPPGGECRLAGPKGKGRVNLSCRTLYDVLIVPLKDGINDHDALLLGRRVVDKSFSHYRLEADRRLQQSATDHARPSSVSDQTPHRVHASVRTQGGVGMRR